MPCSLLRCCALALATALVAGCGAGGAGVSPAPQHGTASTGRTTSATFTITWSSNTPAATLRGTKAISPSAESVSVWINGVLNTVANRSGGTAQQSIALIAPVGNDAFVFDVYDGTNAQGTLLGSATVTQNIVDGAANVVTAVIDAVCAATNVASAGDDPFAYTQTAVTGVLARTLTSIVLGGQSAATLVVEPEDADGNVIINGAIGVVANSITGSATVIPIDGSHIQLQPLTGPRSTTPDTLTLAAPTCPQTTIAVRHSPVIYAEGSGNIVRAYDWYGDQLMSGTLTAGDVLIGYDSASGKLMAYNSSTASVSSYTTKLTTRTPLYAIVPASTVTWSNYLHSVFAAYPVSSSGQFYTYANSAIVDIGVNFIPTSIATSPLSTDSYGYASQGAVFVRFLLTSPYTALGAGPTSEGPVVTALAVDDADGYMFAFFDAAIVQRYDVNFYGPDTVTGNFGFDTAIQCAGIDTDGDNIYGLSPSGTLYLSPGTAASSSTTALTSFAVNVGTPSALVILSTNTR